MSIQSYLDQIDSAIQADHNLLVARIHRYGDPNRFGWHLMVPVEGGGYPFHKTTLGLLNEANSAHLALDISIKRGLDTLAFLSQIPFPRRTPDYTLLDFMIDQVAPLEFQSLMHNGDPSYLERLTVFTTHKGALGKWAVQA